MKLEVRFHPSAMMHNLNIKPCREFGQVCNMIESSEFGFVDRVRELCIWFPKQGTLQTVMKRHLVVYNRVYSDDTEAVRAEGYIRKEFE